MSFSNHTSLLGLALCMGSLAACVPGAAEDDATTNPEDGTTTTMTAGDSSTTDDDDTTGTPDPSTSTGDDGSTGAPDPTDDGTTTGEPDTTDDVVEIAIRRLNEGQDVAEFEAARDAFVALLTAQPGVGTDREFESFLDYSVFMPPTPPVFIGMTQYDSADAFTAAGEAVGESAEAGAFFSTFTPELFTILVPLEAGSEIDLAGIADEPGQVLEVAVRDLSAYEGFDPAAYATARDAFLALLAAQPGFVAEYQWVSPVDADLAVGMTVYDSAEAFSTISQDEGFLGAPETMAFLGTYPPLGGHVNTVVH